MQNIQLSPVRISEVKVRLQLNCFITRFRVAVGVLVGRRCPALLNGIDVDVNKR